MKVFLDTCVWGGAVDELTKAGHDVVWSGSWSKDPGDKEILTQAHAEKRVLVTLDKDFGELAVVHGVRHSGIIRLVAVRAQSQGTTILAVLTKYAVELELGGMVTVEPGRVRVRVPENT